MAPKVAIVYYSTYGHILKLAQAERDGLNKAGIDADIYQFSQTYDAFLLGVPTRYGNFPAQWKAFWDATSSQWSTGAFWGKYAGVFISTGTQGGGQESTALAVMSTLVHHGIIFVPLGYKTAFPQLANLSEIRGGSPWGAGTFASADGSRQPTDLELELATIQGEAFGNAVMKVQFA